MKYISAPFHYQLVEPETFQLKYIHPREDIETWYCTLTKDGKLTGKIGWAWDGASGPTWDTKNTIRASCCHDLLAKLMRDKLLPHYLWTFADQEFDAILEEDGMWKFRRSYWIGGLSLAHGSYALPKNRRKVRVAP